MDSSGTPVALVHLRVEQQRAVVAELHRPVEKGDPHGRVQMDRLGLAAPFLSPGPGTDKPELT